MPGYAGHETLQMTRYVGSVGQATSENIRVRRVCRERHVLSTRARRGMSGIAPLEIPGYAGYVGYVPSRNTP